MDKNLCAAGSAMSTALSQDDGEETPSCKTQYSFSHGLYLLLQYTFKPSKSSSWEMLTRLQSLRAHREYQLRLKLHKICVFSFFNQTRKVTVGREMLAGLLFIG